MKIAQFLIIAAASLLSISETKAATIWSTTFTEPPYTLNSTVIGTQGWTAGTIDSENNEDVSLVANPNSPTGTALEVKSTSKKTANNRRTTVTNSFPEAVLPDEASGNLIQIKFSAAFDTTNTGGTLSINIGFHPSNIAVAPFQVTYIPNSGISLTGTYKDLLNKTLVDASTIKLGAFYDFTFTLNYTTRTFDLLLTGVDNTDSNVSINLKDIGFASSWSTNYKSISGLTLQNFRGDLNTLYMGNISVETIPEPSSTISMLIGAAFAGTWMARKAGKKASAK